MNLQGKNFIGDRLSSGSEETFHAANPSDSPILQPEFHTASKNDVNAAMELAETALKTYRGTTGEWRAIFLERTADEILALGDGLIERTKSETGLP